MVAEAAGVLSWWRALGDRHRRWLVVNAVIGSMFVNIVVNAAISWVSTIGVKHVSVWSVPLLQHVSVFTDALGTFFFLPLTTCILVTRAIRIEQDRHDLPRVDLPVSRKIAWMSPRPVRRGLTLGLLTAAALSPLAALVMAASGMSGLSRPGFILYAAFLGTGLGLVVTPCVAALAMADDRLGV